VKKPVKKPLSGGAKLYASGKRPILIAVTPEEHAILQKAADQDERKLAAWVKLVALRIATTKEKPVKRKS
jgi:hypothetical protein